MSSKILLIIIFTSVSIKVAHFQNITILSIAISEIIENSYTKYTKNVDIIDFGGSQGELVGKIMENLNNSMTVKLIKEDYFLKWTKRLDDQTILLFDDFEYLKWFTNIDFVELRYINPFKFVVYCKNLSVLEILKLKTHNNITPYYYIIYFDQDQETFKLLTFENRNDFKTCREFQRVIKINEFSAENTKWLTEPIFPKKYLNFHGCLMAFGVQHLTPFFPTRWDILGVNTQDAGFGYSLVNLLEKQLNFTSKIFFCIDYNCVDRLKDPLPIYNVISFPILSMFPHEMDSFGWRFVTINVPALPRFFISIDNLYTSSEKFALIFDFKVWIGMAVIFSSALIVEIMKNFFPTSACQNFNQKLSSRALFGSKPLQIYGFRLIIILFIFWYSIIRTAFQGKLFEFTASEIRKPESRTFKDLINSNVPLYFTSMNKSRTIKLKEYDSQYLVNSHNQKVLSNLSDPSFIGAYFETQTELDLMVHEAETPTPKNPIQAPVADSQYAFGFVYTNLWNERLQEIIEGLVSGGIINMHLDQYTKSKWNLMSNKMGIDKTLIDTGHLTFVFQIYVIAGYAAFWVFLGEQIIFLIRIKLKRKMREYEIELGMLKNCFCGVFRQIWAIPKNLRKSSTSKVDNCTRHLGELIVIQNSENRQNNPELVVEDYDESDSD